MTYQQQKEANSNFVNFFNYLKLRKLRGFEYSNQLKVIKWVS